jgi:hypothetical protein
MRILTLILLLPTVLLADQVLYETGFEKSDGVAAGPVGDTSTGWKTNGPNPFVIVATDDGTDGQMMASQAESSSEGSRAWLGNTNLGGDKKTTVEMSFKANNSGSPGYQANLHIGSFKAAPGTSGMAAIISFRGSGKIVAFDGEKEVELTKFQTGAWHKLRVECDPSTQKFDVFVDNEPRGTGLAFNDPDVREILSLGLTHYTGTGATAASGLAVDNIKVSAP